MQKCLLIGISGGSCSGKTTLANILCKDVFFNTKSLHQDDFYHPEDHREHVRLEEVQSHCNWELVSAFDMDKLIKDINEAKDKLEKQNVKDEEDDQTSSSMSSLSSLSSSPTPSELSSCLSSMSLILPPLLFVEGITLFNDVTVASMFDVKIFIELDRPTLMSRRADRHYDPPDPPGYPEKVVWPFYIKNLTEVRNTWNDVFYLDGINTSINHLAKDITNIIVKHIKKNKKGVSK